MVGITLLPEEIRKAPPEVRRWLEQEIAAAFRLYPAEPALSAPVRHLVACSLEEARGILSTIQALLPVVGVFFELGREAAAVSEQGLRALRIDEMLRHAHLQTAEQLIACLKLIDEAYQHVFGQAGAVLTALDNRGHCLVADATGRNVFALWQEIVASRGPPQRTQAPRTDGQQSFQAPYGMPTPTFAAPEQGSELHSDSLSQ